MNRSVCIAALLCVMFFLPVRGWGQRMVQQDTSCRFSPAQLLAPAALLAVGAIGSTIDDFKEIDFGLAERKHHGSQVGATHHSGGFVAEDVLQYVPAASYYALKLSGVKSVHDYRDASVILAASYGMTAVTTKLLKEVSRVQRPNGVDDKSFPSGHSAVAFMGAEFLRMEYRDASPWIGIAGYAVATGTALARVGHNEHWITDVIAGAGTGILCTRVAYWIYPSLQRLLFGKIFKCNGRAGKDMAFIGLPYYDGTSAGISLAMGF